VIVEDSESAERRREEGEADLGGCLYTTAYPTSFSIAILNQPLRRGSCSYPASELTEDPLYVYVYIQSLNTAEDLICEDDMWCCVSNPNADGTSSIAASEELADPHHGKIMLHVVVHI
jgi:hypothetical protein